ncbi:MAG: hypothetical protein PHR30_01985 [Gallionellaceae bacterium]|nr:hypothetical protein [Gallionellaceae bacterium]MDD5364084.1 hypothetical protein [Gallionellaceae bacterium]
MSSTQDDESSQEQAREAFIAGMKTRIEQAQASGQSPEQIQMLAAAYAREEMQRQLPQAMSRAKSWWSGLRNFMLVGALALGLAIGLALFVEQDYATPLCEHYAVQHGVTYRGLEYPVIGGSSRTTSRSGSCMVVNSAGSQNTVSLSSLEPNAAIAILVSFALQIEVTTPIAFVLIALLATSLRKLK